MEEAFSAPVWAGVPELSRGEMALRNALARVQRAGREGEWCRFGEHAFRLVLDEPLARYAVRLDFGSALGRLTVHVECAALHPEYAADTLQALRESGSDLRGLLDWAASPWIEPLEALTGCAFGLEDVVVAPERPPAGVACRLRFPGGQVAHAVLAGPALDMLGSEPASGERRVLPWMRVPVARVMRLRAVTRAELRRLAPGAAIDLRQSEPACLVGEGKRQKELRVRDASDDSVEILGEAGPAGIPREAHHPLWSIDDITVDLDVVLSREALTVDEASALCVGSVLPLKAAERGEQVSLFCQGLPVARGRLIRVEGRLAVLVTHCRGAGS